MIAIDNILADKAVLQQAFLCDLNECKGACCTMAGGRGAPVLDEEVEPMQRAQESALEYLPDRSRAILAAKGGVEGEAGDFATVCIDDADCVYVYYQNGIAQCALERAYKEGKSDFRKPISCHLFPLRVADFGGDYLYYERISECTPALRNGMEKNVRMYQMLQEALERSYGPEWYQKLAALAKRMHDAG